jgi:hypothetical protein
MDHPSAPPPLTAQTQAPLAPPGESETPGLLRRLSRHPKWVGLGAAAAFAAVLVVTVHPGGVLASTHTLSGTVDLFSENPPQIEPNPFGGSPTFFPGQSNFTVSTDGTSCSGNTGYEDLRAGGQVLIKDASGSVIATTSLSAGKPNPQAPDVLCVFSFHVSVPDSAFYQVIVGQRNALSYSRDELNKAKWTVGEQIGQIGS